MITNFSIKNSIPFKQLDLPLSDLTVITGHNNTNIDNITSVIYRTIALFDGDLINTDLFYDNSINLQLNIDGINNMIKIGKNELYPTIFDFLNNNKIIINFNYKYINILSMYSYPYNQYNQLPILIEFLLHPNALSNSLIDQINAWVSELIELLQLKITEEKYIIPSNYLSIATRRLINVVYNILISKPNDVIIIEYPEASLHPSVQSKLMKLLTLAAQNGIQIIMITQSDHIVNGTFIACKRFEKDATKGIDKDKVNIIYCEREGINTKITKIPILRGGKTTVQPDGFFDQTEKDAFEILGF